MRILLQRVRSARVEVKSCVVGNIGPGLLLFVGFAHDEQCVPGSGLWQKMLDKLTGLRIFSDKDGKLNYSVQDTDYEVLVVSQFTLYADTGKGRRPSFHLTAPHEEARGYYDACIVALKARLSGRVQQGSFGSAMDVHLVNWGPVTFMLDF